MSVYLASRVGATLIRPSWNHVERTSYIRVIYKSQKKIFCAEGCRVGHILLLPYSLPLFVSSYYCQDKIII